jgi:NADPH-dependent 2,4-dienoyl-CoA reductase/sulfur reductase-like enzyme
MSEEKDAKTQHQVRLEEIEAENRMAIEARWLEALKRLPRKGGMVNSNNDVALIRLGYDFEPHGLASETWEDVWTITLVTTGYYYKTITSWERGHPNSGIPDHCHFKGHTEAEAKARALEFMEWYIKNRPKEKA